MIGASGNTTLRVHTSYPLSINLSSLSEYLWGDRLFPFISGIFEASERIYGNMALPILLSPILAPEKGFGFEGEPTGL